MHIITDTLESQIFASHMHQSLQHREFWEDWFVLKLSIEPSLDWIQQAKITTLLRSFFSDADGTVLWLEGHLLIVFRDRESLDIETLQKAIQKSLDIHEIKMTLLGVAEAPDKVADLLAQSEGVYANARKAPEASFSTLKSLVPNIEKLLRTWHEEKKVREGRDLPHIMIVDDDPMVLKLVSRAFGGKYKVILAQSFAEAVAKHLQLMPDIIFLDIGLPDCDGLTLLNYIQQYDQDCYVVMFSGDDYLKTRVKAFASGAKGFLGKPFNIRAFQQQIAKWFSGRKV